MRAISALDMALWDIKGQALGVPIYELLGGAVRKRIRVYATGFAYEGAADLARELLDEGITAMKGGPTIALAGATDGQSIHPMDLDRALKPIREIRDAVGNLCGSCAKLMDKFMNAVGGINSFREE